MRFLEERFLWRRPPAIVEAAVDAGAAAEEAGAAAEEAGTAAEEAGAAAVDAGAAAVEAGAAEEDPEDPNKLPSPLAIEPNML